MDVAAQKIFNYATVLNKPYFEDEYVDFENGLFVVFKLCSERKREAKRHKEMNVLTINSPSPLQVYNIFQSVDMIDEQLNNESLNNWRNHLRMQGKQSSMFFTSQQKIKQLIEDQLKEAISFLREFMHINCLSNFTLKAYTPCPFSIKMVYDKMNELSNMQENGQFRRQLQSRLNEMKSRHLHAHAENLKKFKEGLKNIRSYSESLSQSRRRNILIDDEMMKTIKNHQNLAAIVCKDDNMLLKQESLLLEQSILKATIKNKNLRTWFSILFDTRKLQQAEDELNEMFRSCKSNIQRIQNELEAEQKKIKEEADEQLSRLQKEKSKVKEEVLGVKKEKQEKQEKQEDKKSKESVFHIEIPHARVFFTQGEYWKHNV